MHDAAEEKHQETKQERRRRRLKLAGKYSLKGATLLGKAALAVGKGIYNLYVILIVAQMNQQAEQFEQ